MKYFKIIILVFLVIIVLGLIMNYGGRFFNRGYLIFPKIYCEKIRGGEWNECPQYYNAISGYGSPACWEPVCTYKK